MKKQPPVWGYLLLLLLLTNTIHVYCSSEDLHHSTKEGNLGNEGSSSSDIVDDILLYLLPSLTTVFGIVVFTISIWSHILTYHHDNDNPLTIVNGCCKPSISHETKNILSLVAGCFDWVLDFIGIMLAFLAGLFPYTFYSSEVSGLMPIQNFARQVPVAYYLPASLLCLAYATVGPPILTGLYLSQSSRESEVYFEHIPTGTMKRVIIKMWSALKWFSFTAAFRLLSFLLSFYSRTLVYLFIILPWDTAISTYRISFFPAMAMTACAIWMSISFICCITIQGFLTTIVVARTYFKSKQMKNGESSIVAFLISIPLIAWQIISVMISLPQMFQIRMAKTKSIKQCCNYFISLKLFFAAVEAKMEGEHEGTDIKELNEFAGNPDIISWSCFCSRYSQGFLIPIPYIGPYLFLISCMFAKSGFWMQQYWSHVRKTDKILQSPITKARISPEKNDSNQSNEEEELKLEYFAPREYVKDSKAVHPFIIFKTLNLLLPKHEAYESDLVIKKESEADAARYFRFASMLFIPMISLLSFIPFFRNGFDLFDFLLQLIRRS